VAAEANHETNRRRQKRIDAAFDALNDAHAAGGCEARPRPCLLLRANRRELRRLAATVFVPPRYGPPPTRALLRPIQQRPGRRSEGQLPGHVAREAEPAHREPWCWRAPPLPVAQKGHALFAPPSPPQPGKGQERPNDGPEHQQAAGRSWKRPGRGTGNLPGCRGERTSRRERQTPGPFKRSDELATRLVPAIARQEGRLVNPTDPPVSDDLLDDDGLPATAKLQNAIQELPKQKPHLANTRPKVSDIGQGTRPASSELRSVWPRCCEPGLRVPSLKPCADGLLSASWCWES
jgi:hypothetical protein